MSKQKPDQKPKSEPKPCEKAESPPPPPPQQQQQQQLSALEFAELVEGVAKGAYPDAATGDKRRAPRVLHRSRIEVLPYDDDGADRPMLVSVKDFSARGICIVSPARMDRGRVFVARLPRPGGTVVSLLYTVVHCENTGTRQHRVGAELVCVLNRQDSGQQNGDIDRSPDVARIRQSVLG